MALKPYILGSGLAGTAIAEAFALLSLTDQELSFEKPEQISRNAKLADLSLNKESVVCIANPSALHAPRLIEALQAGAGLVICEKPAAVNHAQLRQLQNAKGKVAVLHVYRQLWGIQKMRQLVAEGALGCILAIDGKLWQSSRVGFLTPSAAPAQKREWVGDVNLTGEYGVSLGLGTHWLDIAHFLCGESLRMQHCTVRDMHVGERKEDTYINLQLESASGVHVSGSICNMVHGARNDLEIVILGEKAMARWHFLTPDEIIWATGKEQKTMYRDERTSGSGHPPFHGLGWLEGYIEIIRQSCRDLLGLTHKPYPILEESNAILALLLETRPDLKDAAA
ncbi:MAG: Gfo/Idh/MocA family oxidoreductase [Rickettsiales bacterium]